MKLASALIAAAIALLTSGAQAQSNLYGSTGSFQGRTDNQGNMFGATGAYQGLIDAQGNLYGPTGAYQGRVSR